MTKMNKRYLKFLKNKNTAEALLTVFEIRDILIFYKKITNNFDTKLKKEFQCKKNNLRRSFIK